MQFTDFTIDNQSFSDICELCSRARLETLANEYYIKSKGTALFSTPVSKVGGRRAQDEDLEENVIGRNLVLSYRQIFNPESEEDKINIVRNAYISSQKREQHVEPIRKELKRLNLPSKVNSTLISTESPTEIVETLRESNMTQVLPNSLMLLIGKSGSGKSTFVRYFKEVVLASQHEDIYKYYDWVFLNMNSAPVSENEVYCWLRKEIINSLTAIHSNIKFNSRDVLLELFKTEINEFKEGIGQFIQKDINAYNMELYKVVAKNQEDPEKFLKAILNYMKEHLQKVPILVLDNSDKRTKDEQLLMFQVAEWLRTEFECIVFLPMRDSTFDTYKLVPPLDTVIKDYTFRIDSADVLKVLQARFDYLVRTNKKQVEYELGSSLRVKVSKDKQIEYFKLILKAIRENEWIKKIFYKLSNGDTREAIQLFADFCRSGHVNSEDVFKLGVSEGEYKLPQYKFMNALLRKNRRYYSENISSFINLFHSEYKDDFPDPFVRVDILMWLWAKMDIVGDNRVQGFHRINNMLKDLQLIGHDEKVIIREINELAYRGLIISENQNDELTYADLVKISPSGTLHLELLKNISYISACAEDTLFKDSNVMTRISKRIILPNYLELIPLILTAKDLLNYLDKYKNEFKSSPEVYLKEGEYFKMYDIQHSILNIEQLINADPNLKIFFGNLDTYTKGVILKAQIVKKDRNSIVCVFDEARGFLATTEPKFNLSKEAYNLLSVNDFIECEIIEFDYIHNSFQLKFKSS